MKSTSDLANFLRNTSNDPSFDLQSKNKLDNPLNFVINDVMKCVRISNCVFHFQLENTAYLVSFCLNLKDIEKIITDQYSSLTVNKKYNKIYYDVILIN